MRAAVPRTLRKPPVIPPSLIPSGCRSIAPEMLPLVQLDPQHIEAIERAVPGGAAYIQDIYPLAPLQEGILLHHQLNERSDAYILHWLLEIRSQTKLEALIEALQAVIDRYDILRSAVLWEQLPQPLQVVHRRASLPVEELALDPHLDTAKQLEEWMRLERHKLDLHQAPLMRLYVTPARHMAPAPRHALWYAVLQVHHLICDAQSFQILFADIVAHLKGHATSSPEPVQFRTYVAQTLAHARTLESEAFFRRKLGDLLEPTVPFGVSDVHADGSQAGEAIRDIALPLALQLRDQARRLHVSATALFHAAWALVASRLAGQNDVVFGTVLFGRLQASHRAQQIVGMLLNTLPLRLRLKDSTAEQLVQQTHQELMDLMSVEHASLSIAQHSSGISGSMPLFTTLLNYRHGVRDAQNQLGGESTGIRVLSSRARANYPIIVSVDDLSDQFKLTVQTDQRIDSERVAEYLHTALRSLSEALDGAPWTQARSLTILPANEERELLQRFNATETSYPKDKLAHQLFEEQVQSTPDAVAVAYDNQTLTYAELNRRANQLARCLSEKGVGREQLVGLCVERSLEMVVGLVGIWKAGCAYLPLDPNHPAERLAYVLSDASAIVVVAQEHTRTRLPAAKLDVVTLDSQWNEIARYDSVNHDGKPNEQNSHQLAYTIYTSGSTGRPKGVLVEHRNVVNHWQAVRSLYDAPHDCRRIGLNAPVTFDASVQQLVQLLSGRTVCIVPPAARLDAALLFDFLERHQIEGIDCTPSQLNAWVASGLLEGKRHCVRTVLVGGEAIEPSLWQRLARCSAITFYNVYGPTECTVDSTFASLREPSRVPHIGRPLPNTRVYVLDENRGVVPIGVVGELHIAGAGVARGYLNRPDLTARRFVSDPFSSDPQARMYKTGDLARWRTDGTLEYLGRNDQQVKIRGFRIELGEIEAQLARHPFVKEAVVLAREDVPGERRLVAYVIAQAISAPETPSVQALRAHLSEALPDYMIPSAFVLLESFPQTSSGKLDRLALPAPERAASPRHEPPQGELEVILAEIWQSHLRVERVGRDDDFFELGGHSLLGTKVIAKIAERFTVQLPVVTIFQCRTLRQMAQRLEPLLLAAPASPTAEATASVQAVRPLSSHPSTELPLAPRLGSRPVPLTHCQRWLWTFQKLASEHGMRTVAGAVRLRGPLNTEFLREGLLQVVRRHEALRTRIVAQAGVPLQHVDERGEIPLEIVDLTNSSTASESEVRRLAQQLAFEPFSLATDPLSAARLVKLAGDTHVLIVATTHIISDAASVGILLRELTAFYRQFAQSIPVSLAKIPIQLADYALWQHRTYPIWAQQHEAFWQQRLAGARQTRVPQVGRPTPATLPLRFDEGLTKALRELSRREKTTLVMTVLTVYVALVCRWFDTADVVIPFTAAGRHHPMLESVIGAFGVPLFLRIALFKTDRFTDLLRRVTHEYTNACEHEDFGAIAAQMPEPEFVWNPTFNWIPQEFSVTPLSQATEGSAQDALIMEPCGFEITPPETFQWSGQLRLDLSDQPDGIAGTLMYRTDSFTPGAMEQFRNSLSTFAQRWAADPGEVVSSAILELPPC